MKQRGRPKKKDTDPSLSMEELLAKAVELFRVPYDDRDGDRTGTRYPGSAISCPRVREMKVLPPPCEIPTSIALVRSDHRNFGTLAPLEHRNLDKVGK